MINKLGGLSTILYVFATGCFAYSATVHPILAARAVNVFAAVVCGVVTVLQFKRNP